MICDALWVSHPLVLLFVHLSDVCLFGCMCVFDQTHSASLEELSISINAMGLVGANALAGLLQVIC